MEGLVLHCTVRAYEHLEVVSVLSFNLLYLVSESYICVCNIDDCGKLNVIWVLYFVKIFTGECVKLGYKDVVESFL